MRDENKDDHQVPRQPVMPYISVPTKTARAHDALPNQQPPSVTTTSSPSTSGFWLGIDTCGFTTSSTITCSFGYECTNVGSNRGCCLPGDYDCISTIYTDCIEYGEAPNAGACGPHTLCCSDSKPYCFTYAYSTDKDPGATFTYVECNPTNGYGEMFPFPQDMTTTTSTTDTSSSSTSQPSASHSSTSSMGGIIGGVIGSVFVVVFIIVAIALLFRRRRRGRQATVRATRISAPLQTPHSSTDISPTGEKEQAQVVAAAARANGKANRRSLLRPLSLIREHPTSTPIATASPSSPPPVRHKHKSAAPTITPARQSFGPNWPLGPDPVSNPLGAHPIDARLKKRLSDSRLGAQGLATATATAMGSGGPPNSAAGGVAAGSERPLRVPMLNLPPPGTRRPPPKSPRSSGSTPTSAGVALQSPRLDWVPVSPILGVAFGDGNGNGNRRSVGWVDDGAGSRRDDAATGTGTGAVVDTEREPVSPIGSDEVEEDLQRSSYVSAPSAYSALSILVSPISAREAEGDGGDGDVTVSPLESRRGSLDV